MRLHDALHEECIAPHVRLANKQEALRAVVAQAKKSSLLAGIDEKDILAGLEEREALGSTGFGNGIAIPHCRLAGVSHFVMGIITVPDGVDFDALDEKPVKLVVFIIAPEDDAEGHLRMLSATSQVLHGPGVIDEILKETTAVAVRESFLRHANGELDMDGQKGKRMVYVFVQEETLFQDMIEVFTAMEQVSAIVLNSENMAVYYTRIPLFQGLWAAEPGGFSRVICAVVDAGLTNEIVRQIETRTGDLNKQTGIMIAIHDLLYVAGSLNI